MHTVLLTAKNISPGAGHPRMLGAKSWLSERPPTQQGTGFLPAFGKVDGAELCSFLLLPADLLSEDRLLRRGNSAAVKPRYDLSYTP